VVLITQFLKTDTISEKLTQDVPAQSLIKPTVHQVTLLLLLALSQTDYAYQLERTLE